MANPSRILSINGGSSSIKFAVFDATSLERILAGGIDGIGRTEAVLHVTGDSPQTSARTETVAAPDYKTAIALLVAEIQGHCGPPPLVAVGHRLVHGGSRYSQPALITPDIIDALDDLSPYDPDHMPGELLLIKALGRHFPEARQVACFDTAFHHHMPRVAQLLPIPRRYEALGVRRYGFHGLSYAFLMEEFTRLAGPVAAQGRIILAHLGSGASLAAVKNGQSLDTSMGFTPTAGLPMSTRSGDLDPGLAWYLARTEGLDAQGFNSLVNTQSGLLGISETSADMAQLLQSATHDERAAEAVDFFCYQTKKWIGSFAAVLGGLDTLIFSGGIGENAPAVRARICSGMEFLGIALDDQQNAAQQAIISKTTSRVVTRIIHTDEERMIARLTYEVLGLKQKDTE